MTQIHTCAESLLMPRYCCEMDCTAPALVSVLCFDGEDRAVEHARCLEHILMPGAAATKAYHLSPTWGGDVR